jgi:hypothetical protein
MSVSATPSLTKPVLGVSPIFARHETFHPRYGWLKKAVDKVLEQPSLFLDEDAPVTLGVGKNMVSAIRYWSQAFKLVEESSEQTGHTRQFSVTGFGKQLLQEGGFDPYIENTATLWLLHWQLLKPQCQAASWFYIFNLFTHPSFSVEEALSGLQKYKNEQHPTAKAVTASLKKDEMCLLRMYASTHSESQQVKEESLDSPFRELGLIQHVHGNQYQFNVGAKFTLPAEIIAYACLDYALFLERKQTINMDTLLYMSGSPGLIFKLSQAAIYNALDEVGRVHKSLKISEAAGLIQVIFDGDIPTLQDQLLKHYYSRG